MGKSIMTKDESDQMKVSLWRTLSTANMFNIFLLSNTWQLHVIMDSDKPEVEYSTSEVKLFKIWNFDKSSGKYISAMTLGEFQWKSLYTYDIVY